MIRPFCNEELLSQVGEGGKKMAGDFVFGSPRRFENVPAVSASEAEVL